MPAKRYKTKDGKPAVSVSRVLNGLGWGKEGLMHWAWKEGWEGRDYKDTRNKLAGIGSQAHYAVEADIKGEPYDVARVPMSEEDREAVRRTIESWRAWKNVVAFEAIASELELVSEIYKFGGTFDLGLHVGLAKRRYALIDLKTGKARESHLVQIAAYRQLWNENHPEQQLDEAYLLLLDRDTGAFHWNYYPTAVMDSGWRTFRALRLIHDEKPIIKKAV